MPRNSTATAKDTRSRAWCFTMYRTDEPVFNKESMTYMIFQREKCPDTGREHWQGYVYFKAQKTMSSTKRQLNDLTVHLEKAKGNHEQNKTYCSKEESRVEGTQPKEHGVLPVQGKRTDLMEVAHAIAKGVDDRTLCEEFPEVMIKYGKSAQNYRTIMLSKGARKKKTFVIFISGEAGTNKSRTVFEMFPDAYPKDGRNKWFDSYYCQDVVSLDDFYGIDGKGNGIPLSKMLNLMDRYPCLVEQKGRSTQFNSDVMFITSNKPPEEMYSHLTYEWLPSFRRRIDIEYKHVGDDYDVGQFTQRGWYRRHFDGRGKPLSWERCIGDIQEDMRFMFHLRKWLPKPAEIEVEKPIGPMTEREAINAHLDEMSEDEEVVEEERRLRMAELDRAEAIEIEDSEEEAIVPASPLPNAAELLAVETLGVEMGDEEI